MSYNGWSNRETWLINLWFEPQSQDEVHLARQVFEDAVDNLPDFLRDFVSENIDWNELLEHLDTSEEDEFLELLED